MVNEKSWVAFKWGEKVLTGRLLSQTQHRTILYSTGVVRFSLPNENVLLVDTEEKVVDFVKNYKKA